MPDPRPCSATPSTSARRHRRRRLRRPDGGQGAAPASRSGVTLVDRQNHHLFQPLLYQVATAGALARATSPRRSAGSCGGRRTSACCWPRRRGRRRRQALRLRRRRPSRYDYLIARARRRPTPTSATTSGRRTRPGLKTLDDALAMRAQVLLAFERAERASDGDERRRLLTFVIVGGGPTGVELAGALAEIARHALRHEFHTIDPGTATRAPARGRARRAADVSPEAADARAPRSRSGSASTVRTERARSTRIEAGRRARRRRAHRGGHDALGGRRRRPRRSARRSACRSIASAG